MLISKNTKPEISIFKLSNGDEVVASIQEFDGAEYKVENPFVLINTQTGPQFAPMLMMADLEATTSIYASSVVARCKPSPAIVTGYEKSTSKIMLPPQQGIIV